MQTHTDTHRSILTPADRIALVGLAGIALSITTWFLIAGADVVLGQSASFSRAAFDPTEPQMLVRLTVVVFVLFATLIVQMVTGQRFRIERRLMVEREWLHQMYENSPEGIVLMDPQHTVAYANPAARELFAAGADTEAQQPFVGRPCREALWGGDGEACAGCLAEQVIASSEPATRVLRDTGSGEDRWFEQTVYPAFDEDGQLESIVEVVRDVSVHVNAQRTIHRMAYHDPLTDLPNRLLFQDRLNSALAQARRRRDVIAVVYLDLDDFKSVNDGLGHAIGDGVLKTVAARLTTLLREEDTIARPSGDEFTVVARIAQRGDAEVLAERIAEALRPEMVVDGHVLSISASMGISTYPYDGDNERDLIKNADAAMYRAKEGGHGTYRVYAPEMSESATDRLALETDLRHAIANEEFELFYQPQIDSRDGHPVGVEALIRWNHPDRGLLSPDAFLDFAEQTGFMSQIGPWVTRTACMQMQAWLRSGLDVGRVAVNLSAREFVQYDVVHTVAGILEETGLAPHRLELEITETTAMHSADRIIHTLEALRDIGVRVAIDDFGTGYSSMSYLKRFPVQTLKIAQTFMQGVHLDAQSAAIAAMLIDLCRELGLDIVAEGVEHPSELEFLRQQGCFVIQGYIYSPPLPASGVELFLGNPVPAHVA